MPSKPISRTRLNKTQQSTDRKSKKIKDGQEKGRENKKERTDESEAGPGPDIAKEGQGREYGQQQEKPDFFHK
jgi:hypothetical protein